MPDIATHVLTGFWIKSLRKPPFKLDLSIFLIGCALPDILSRSGIILFSYDYYWFFSVLHTPIAIMLQCLAFSCLFDQSNRQPVFVNLFYGSLFHQILDLFQGGVTSGQYFWFFPFSNWTWGIDLFKVPEWPYVFGGSVIITCISFLVKKLVKS